MSPISWCVSKLTAKLNSIFFFGASKYAVAKYAEFLFIIIIFNNSRPHISLLPAILINSFSANHMKPSGVLFLANHLLPPLPAPSSPLFPLYLASCEGRATHRWQVEHSRPVTWHTSADCYRPARHTDFCWTSSCDCTLTCFVLPCIYSPVYFFISATKYLLLWCKSKIPISYYRRVWLSMMD